MNTSDDDIISSGLLELYAAGALLPDEVRRVEAMLQTHPHVAAELARIEADVERYSALHHAPPRAGLKSRVMDAVAAADAGPVHTAPPTTQAAAVFPMPSRRTYMAVASVAFLVGLVPGVYFYFQYKTTNARLDSVRSELADVRSQQTVVAQKAVYYEHAVEGLADTSAIRIHMPGVKSSAHATVWWNKASHSAMIDIAALPQLADDKDYQLWAIVDGKPVDLGVVRMERQGTAPATRLQNVRSVAAPQAFAITVEPRGGRATPTLESMIVLGSVIQS